jgi:uncharacterized protein (TIGR00369 family)
MDSAERSTAARPDHTAAHERVFGALAQRTRELIDATLHTTCALDEVEEVTAAIEALTARLAKDSDPGYLGATIGSDGRPAHHGNAVIGLRNPIAPPLQIDTTADGTARATFHLGAAYEGPPDLVHGGVSALVLDQVLGQAAAAGGAPGMTAQLDVTYRRPTPLGDLTAEARIEQVEGYKTTVAGSILGPDGEPTVEARALFIRPRWAREEPAAERPEGFE